MPELIEIRLFFPDEGIPNTEIGRLESDIIKLSGIPPLLEVTDEIKRHVHLIHRQGKFAGYIVEDFCYDEKTSLSYSDSRGRIEVSLEDLDRL